MTCTLHNFPADDAIFARLTEQQHHAELLGQGFVDNMESME